jgi:hypothetical protein
MMKKFFLILFILFLIQGCFGFEKNETLLITHQISNGDIIEIYFVTLGATTSDVIQVRKSNQSKPIKVFKHNVLKKSILLNDYKLLLVLSDSSYNNYTPIFDTVIVNLQ